MMYQRLVTLIILSAFISFLWSCSSMRYLAKEEISEVEQKSKVWVTMTDGTRYEISEPKVQGSKLVGYVEGEGNKEIDFSEIESIGVEELNKGKTVLLCVGVIAGIILISATSNGGANSTGST